MLLLTPLIQFPFTRDAYEFPKGIFISLIGILILFLFNLGCLCGFYKLRKPPVLILLLLGVYVISSFFSSYGHTSLWGYHGRLSGGSVLHLIYTGLFIVSYSFFDEKSITKMIFLSLLVSSFLTSLIGIMQYFGFGADPLERVYSTFGQPNWLAAFLVFGLMCFMHLYLKADSRRKSILYLIALTPVLLCLWLTFSLSGWLGFFAGLLLLCFLGRSRYSFKKLIPVFLVLLLFLTLFPGQFLPKIRDSLMDLDQQFGGFPRVVVQAKNSDLLPTSREISDPGFIRISVWEGAVKLFSHYPSRMIFGHGPGSFAYLFPFFRPDSLNYSSEWNLVFSKPHNYFLELLIEVGLSGLLLYLAILFKGITSGRSWNSAIFTVFGLVVFFSWPAVTMSLYFWILLSGAYLYEEK